MRWVPTRRHCTVRKKEPVCAFFKMYPSKLWPIRFCYFDDDFMFHAQNLVAELEYIACTNNGSSHVLWATECVVYEALISLRSDSMRKYWWVNCVHTLRQFPCTVRETWSPLRFMKDWWVNCMHKYRQFPCTVSETWSPLRCMKD